jgi:hypothetical protein
MTDVPYVAAPTFRQQPLFFILGCAANLLILSFALLSLYGTIWEYSTHEYLRGFSDAIVPFAATPEQRVEAILNWMNNGPARNQFLPAEDSDSRDPVDNLNYATLLRTCGNATNAFVNLADASGLSVRRLLLLSPEGKTSHVVAEVQIDRRWVVVDPSFRTIPKDRLGNWLTREQLAQPETFELATSGIPHYDPRYNYVHTAHIHLARLPLVGLPVERALDSLFPHWDESVRWTMLVERPSFALLVTGLALLLLSLVFRRGLDYYGRKYLGVGRVHLRLQLRQGSLALLGLPLRHL